MESKERVLELLKRNRALKEFATDESRITKIVQDSGEREDAELNAKESLEPPLGNPVSALSMLAEASKLSKLSLGRIGHSGMLVFLIEVY